MRTYLIMQNPGHSRVYFEQSTKLALAELKIAGRRFENGCQVIEPVTIANIIYLSFTVEKPLTTSELSLLARLSFIFALFELVETDGRTALLPLALASADHVDPKISQLLKYSGKTNELFTRMMINVGLLSSGFDYGQHIQLLDPVAGKGTTLFEGAVYGFDVAGVEINKKFFHEAGVFFKKFLEQERFKHELTKIRGARKNTPGEADVQVFEFAANKDDFKREGGRKRLELVCGDTVNTGRYFKRNSFHLVVGDLPYGIAHRNVPRNKQSSPSRNPAGLLSVCLPAWHQVLKKDGVLVLSWNTFVLSRDDLIRILSDNGFQVFSEDPYNDFEHRVDMSIKRDLVVARK